MHILFYLLFRSNGFTVIKPDPAKKAKIQSIARRDEKNLADARQKRTTIKTVHEINRLGGSRTNLNVHNAREKFLQKYENDK